MQTVATSFSTLRRFNFSACASDISIAAIIVLSALYASGARAAQFVLDLEAAGFLPGQSGGKSITALVGPGTYALDIYGLFQGNDATAANDSIKVVAAWFRSSTGGLLGDLSAAATGPWSQGVVQNGTQQDIDLDGDLDIGGTFSSTSFFEGNTNLGIDYGFGPGSGAQTGTIPAAQVGLSGADFAYGKVGTLTFSVGALQALSAIPGAQTTITMLPPTTTTGGSVSNIFQGHEGGVFGQFGSGTNINGNTPDVVTLTGVTIGVVPEPASPALFGIGAVVLIFVCSRRVGFGRRSNPT